MKITLYKKIVLHISLIVLFSSAIYGEEKETAAVLDFDGYGISKMESITLTQRFSSYIVKTDKFILVERGMMEEIMQEQGFQQTGCTSAECAVEVGALLGVENMISGSFGKLGNTYTIEAKIFSVQSGKVTKAVSKTYKGEIDGLLLQVENLAYELADKKPVNALSDSSSGRNEGRPNVAQQEKKGGSKWLLWTGAAIVAGGAAYFLSQSEEPTTNGGGGTTPISGLPLPPGHP